MVTRNGRRHEIEADTHKRALVANEWRHELWDANGLARFWPEEQVVVVQRRDGHRLEQVWPTWPTCSTCGSPLPKNTLPDPPTSAAWREFGPCTQCDLQRRYGTG